MLDETIYRSEYREEERSNDERVTRLVKIYLNYLIMQLFVGLWRIFGIGLISR